MNKTCELCGLPATFDAYRIVEDGVDDIGGVKSVHWERTGPPHPRCEAHRGVHVCDVCGKPAIGCFGEEFGEEKFVCAEHRRGRSFEENLALQDALASAR